MRRSVGVYFGAREVTAVALDRRGNVSEWTPIPRKSDEREYTHDELASIVKELAIHLRTVGDTLTPSLPMRSMFYRRVEWEKKHRNGEALRYAVEPALPVPVETVHLSTVDSTDNDVGVLALPTHPWNRLFECIDEQGWISPRAVSSGVSAWEVLSELQPNPGQFRILCLADREEGAILAGFSKTLVAARSLAYQDSGSTETHMGWVAHELARTAWYCGIGKEDYTACVLYCQDPVDDQSNCDESVRIVDLQEVLPDLPARTWGTFFAYCAARSSIVHAPTNLRTDNFRSERISRGNRRCVLLHSIAATAATLVLSLGIFLHGQKCSRQKETYRKCCQEIWTSLFPGESLPSNVRFRLQSELTKEQGLRKEDTGMPSHRSALDTLRDIVASVPKNVPIRVSEIDVSEGVILISGHARTHGEVESIASSLAQQKDLHVLPATTERVGNGTVRFSLRLELKEHRDEKRTI